MFPQFNITINNTPLSKFCRWNLHNLELTFISPTMGVNLISTYYANSRAINCQSILKLIKIQIHPLICIVYVLTLCSSTYFMIIYDLLESPILQSKSIQLILLYNNAFALKPLCVCTSSCKHYTAELYCCSSYQPSSLLLPVLFISLFFRLLFEDADLPV